MYIPTVTAAPLSGVTTTGTYAISFPQRWNFCPSDGQKLESHWNNCPKCGAQIPGAFTVSPPLYSYPNEITHR